MFCPGPKTSSIRLQDGLDQRSILDAHTGSNVSNWARYAQSQQLMSRRRSNSMAQ